MLLDSFGNVRLICVQIATFDTVMHIGVSRGSRHVQSIFTGARVTFDNYDPSYMDCVAAKYVFSRTADPHIFVS